MDEYLLPVLSDIVNEYIFGNKQYNKCIKNITDLRISQLNSHQDSDMFMQVCDSGWGILGGSGVLNSTFWHRVFKLSKYFIQYDRAYYLGYKLRFESLTKEEEDEYKAIGKCHDRFEFTLGNEHTSIIDNRSVIDMYVYGTVYDINAEEFKDD